MHSPAWWWSWLLMVVGVTGLYFSGKKYWWGWLIGLLSEVLWVVYAVTTKQYGFIVFAAVYAAVFIKNAREWYKSGPV
jgi:hypothetical protein